MEEKLPVTTKRSGFTRWIIFTRSHPLLSLGSIVGGLLLVCVVGLTLAGGVGYVVYDYTMHNPKFCITCHDLMIDSYQTWATSEHAQTNCHTCHHITPEVFTSHIKAILTGMPDRIPPRPAGKIIVPDKYCLACHWDGKKQYGEASEWLPFLFPDIQTPEKVNKVTDSRFHARHYFMEATACVACHGEKRLHVFKTASGDCLACHKDKPEKLHAAQTVDLACFNCHTDRTVNLNPDRAKCLFCHGEQTPVKEALLSAITIDVKYAQPSQEVRAKAVKIKLAPDAPMQQLNCAACHKSHEQNAKPDAQTCLSCHPSIADVGRHQSHLELVQGDCMQCHQPHSWKTTADVAQTTCRTCHATAPDPKAFLRL